MRVVVETNECIASGQCVLIADDVFALDYDDEFVRVIDPEPPADRAAALREAEASCPSQAITILEE